MLARARSRVGFAASVRVREADLFSWKADRRYDAVFFGFWISHVPDDKFTSFWTMVAEALMPGGHVFFFDDNHRCQAELVEGTRCPIVQRKLNDGTPFKVVKVAYEFADLEERLRDLQWNVGVTGTSGPFYGGTGVR